MRKHWSTAMKYGVLNLQTFSFLGGGGGGGGVYKPTYTGNNTLDSVSSIHHCGHRYCPVNASRHVKITAGDRKGNPCPSIKILWPTIFPSSVSIPDEIDACLKTGLTRFLGPSKRCASGEARYTKTSEKLSVHTSCIHHWLVKDGYAEYRMRAEIATLVEGNGFTCQFVHMLIIVFFNG